MDEGDSGVVTLDGQPELRLGLSALCRSHSSLCPKSLCEMLVSFPLPYLCPQNTVSLRRTTGLPGAGSSSVDDRIQYMLDYTSFFTPVIQPEGLPDHFLKVSPFHDGTYSTEPI